LKKNKTFSIKIKDLIALPNFPGVSSASWGLNGFHEDYILLSNAKNSLIDFQRVALMVAKEIAHYVKYFISFYIA